MYVVTSFNLHKTHPTLKIRTTRHPEIVTCCYTAEPELELSLASEPRFFITTPSCCCPFAVWVWPPRLNHCLLRSALWPPSAPTQNLTSLTDFMGLTCPSRASGLGLPGIRWKKNITAVMYSHPVSFSVCCLCVCSPSSAWLTSVENLPLPLTCCRFPSVRPAVGLPRAL